MLVDTLLASYQPDHEVVLYEASPYPVCLPFIRRLALADIPSADVPTLATLYVPPAGPRRRDSAALRALGLAT